MATKSGSIKVDTGSSGPRMIEVDYPSNTHKVKKESEKEEPVKKVNKIIKGTVVTKKKSFFKKAADAFLGEDVPNVGSYILYDVIIPATKSTISDMISGGVDMMFFGESRGSRTRRDKGKSYTSYSNYYNRSDPRHDGRDREKRDYNSRSRANHNFDDIILDTRGEAEDVLSHLVDLIIDYDQATVADLYDLVGVTTSFTDNKYGWDNLASATVSRVRDGYLINLPKTILLD